MTWFRKEHECEKEKRLPHAIANEENGPVVADNVVVTLLGVELDRETPGVTEELRRVDTMNHSGQTNGKRCLLTIGLHKVGHSDVREVGSDREHTCKIQGVGRESRRARFELTTRGFVSTSK